MATTPSQPANRASLNRLLAAAGDSLKSAQSEMSIPLGTPAGMLLSEAVLEVKATVQQSANGELELDLIGSSHLAGQINPSAVSTLRMSFTAAALETARAGTSGGTAGSGAAPGLSADKIREDYIKRPDVAAVAKIVGPLTVTPRYLSETQQWQVTAKDATGRTVRSQLIDDVPARS